MRIAISGTHFSGKSSLVAALQQQFPNYTVVEEPYLLLEAEGYEFFDPPSIEDFEEQFEYSIQSIMESQDNTIFDRSPLDFLAYAQSLGDIDIDDWAYRMESAIELLDLIVFVPIEDRDRIPVPPTENLRLRKKVDGNLQDLLLDDMLGILTDIEILEVVGSVEQRMNIVKAKLEEGE